MKRCPECEFLYEDAQDRCDMDGTRLNSTVTLPPLPLPQPVGPPLKSIWSGFTIPLLVLVLLSTVLVILYRAAPSSFRSAASLKSKEVVNQDSRESKRPASEASPELVTAPETSPEPDERSTITQTKATKSDRPLRFTIAKEPTSAPESHIQIEPAIPTKSAPKPPTSQPLENAPSPASERSQAGSNSISAQPEPPPPSPASQPATQNQQKDSKVKSFLKKAGRILKKPF
jgi:hypothetical protein